MTTFRRMKLINEAGNNPVDFANIVKHQTNPIIHRMSDLDNDIDTILNQDLDDELKAKLYSQTLRRFMSMKNIKKQGDLDLESKSLDKFKTLLANQSAKLTTKLKKQLKNLKSSKSTPKTLSSGTSSKIKIQAPKKPKEPAKSKKPSKLPKLQKYPSIEELRGSGLTDWMIY